METYHVVLIPLCYHPVGLMQLLLLSNLSAMSSSCFCPGWATWPWSQTRWRSTSWRQWSQRTWRRCGLSMRERRSNGEQHSFTLNDIWMDWAGFTVHWCSTPRWNALLSPMLLPPKPACTHPWTIIVSPTCSLMTCKCIHVKSNTGVVGCRFRSLPQGVSRT